VVEELQEEVSDLMTQIENIHMEARASRTKITEVINQVDSIIYITNFCWWNRLGKNLRPLMLLSREKMNNL
jgi:hypothetical protein